MKYLAEDYHNRSRSGTEKKKQLPEKEGKSMCRKISDNKSVGREEVARQP